MGTIFSSWTDRVNSTSTMNFDDTNKVEDVTISINLVFQFKDKFPIFDILLDGAVLYSSSDTKYFSNNQTFNFQQKLSRGQHLIGVKYTETPAAMTNVEIAGIAFNDLWVREDYMDTRAIFYTDSPTVFDGNTVTCIELYRHLGISGTWQFAFSIPLLAWRIVENPHKNIRPTDDVKYATFVGDQVKFSDHPLKSDPNWKPPEKQASLPFVDKIINQYKK
jgi:hypothetical protein